LPQFDPGAMTVGDAVQAASLSQRPPIVADTTAASNVEYYLASETALSFTQGLTRNLTLGAGYGYRRSDSQSQARDFRSHSWSGPLSYAVAKGVAIHGGYGYNDTRYENPTGGSTDYQGRTIDAGVSYSKALSFSRRTSMSFSTGTAGINDGVQTHYSLTG